MASNSSSSDSISDHEHIYGSISSAEENVDNHEIILREITRKRNEENWTFLEEKTEIQAVINVIIKLLESGDVADPFRCCNEYFKQPVAKISADIQNELAEIEFWAKAKKRNQ